MESVSRNFAQHTGNSDEMLSQFQSGIFGEVGFHFFERVEGMVYVLLVVEVSFGKPYLSVAVDVVVCAAFA